MNYTIKQIEAQYNRGIEQVIRTCLIEFGGNREGTAWCDPDLGRFSEIYGTLGKAYWVAVDEKNCVIGGVGIGPLTGIGGVCELQKLYCLPKARGTGIAHALMKRAMDYAARYYRQIYLETFSNMIAAQKFYEKYGFERIAAPLVQTEHFSCDVFYQRTLDTHYDEADVRADYEQLTKYLIAHHLTITTMESATSGQIASLITDTEGASAVLKGAFITYSNEAKIREGVPKEIINTYSVYSKETAEAMAQSCRAAYRADIGIGVTGTMGNIDPVNEAHSEVGRVYFAVSTERKTRSFCVELLPQSSRLMYKMAAAKEVYDQLMPICQELTGCDKIADN